MRFLASKAGTVHTVGRDTNPCPVVKQNLRLGGWKGRKSLSPEAALDLKDCKKCDTHKVAKAEVRAARAKARAQSANEQEVARFNRVGLPEQRLRHDGKTQKVALRPKSSATPPVEDKGQRLADEHAKLAKDHGWAVEVIVEPLTSTPRTWMVQARKGDEMVQVSWTDGKVDYPKVIAFFPTHQYWLKNTTQWRRQVSLPDSQRPAKREPKNRPPRVPGTPKAIEEETLPSGEPVLETDGVKFSSTELPFEKDADDIVVINHLKGRIVYWRNNMAAKIEKAEVPTVNRLIRIAAHPTNGRRIVSFPEVLDYGKNGVVYGCERSVALDQMIKIR